MAFSVAKVEVWAGDIPNQPGTLAGVLEALSKAGANMEFMIARKLDDNTSRVFVAPVKSAKVQKAASAAGFNKTANLFTMRVEGPDKAGVGARLTRAVADAGVNLRGASVAGLGKTAVFYLAVDSESDLQNAMKVAKSAVNSKPPKKTKPAMKRSKSGSKKVRGGKSKSAGRPKSNTASMNRQGVEMAAR